MQPAYFTVFFWSLAIFASFWGYGEILRRRIDLPEFSDIGWGLTAAWGMSVVLAIGGVLMAFHLAKAPALTFVVLFGASASLFFATEDLIGSGKGKIKNQKSEILSCQFPVSNFLLSALAFLAFATSIFWPNQIDPNDDWIAYLMYPEKILQTGTLIDPFSLRRVTALGGQSLLQAIVMIVGEPENGHVLDRGFGALILLGLMFQATRDVPKRWWFVRFLVVFASMAAAVPRIHTGSHLLGLDLLLALLITLSRLLDLQKWTPRDAVPLALVLAGASTLRPTFAMVGGGMLIFYFMWSSVRASPGRRLDTILPLIYSGGLTFFILLPYMITSWQSSGTPMFPFSSGYGNPLMMFGGTKEGGWTNWAAALKFISIPEIAVMAIGLLVAGMLDGRQRMLGIAAAFAGFGMVFLSAFKMSAADFYDVYRYTYPLIAFPLFWILARAVASPDKDHLFSGPVTAGLAVAVFFTAHFSPFSREFQFEIAALPKETTGFKFQVAQLEPAYKQLQELVPPGEKIFAVVDAPYLLDFARNPIDNIDSIGGASLPPGMPFEKGPEALKNYLSSHGYRYVLCVDFDNAVLLYTRKLWQNHPRHEWYFKEIWAKYALDFMRNMDLIADWATTARAGNVRLIDLVK
ncbi:MAG: hypothetical protein WCG52_07415 [bacterium]